MGLKSVGTVLYHGVLASFTGGWLPVRSINLKLIVFHLYLFLSLLVSPLLIYLVSRTHPVGWVVYAVFVLATFAILKWYNFHLHKALGSDPEPEPPEPEPETEGNETEDETENKSEVRRIEFDPASSEPAPDTCREGSDNEMRQEAEGLPQDNLTVDDDEQLRNHRSSASTLNNSSNHLPSDFELSEVQSGIPLSSCQDDGVPGAASTIDVTEMPAGSGQGGGGGGENDLKLHVAEGVAEVKDMEQLSVGEMINTPASPIHRSNPSIAQSFSQQRHEEEEEVEIVKEKERDGAETESDQNDLDVSSGDDLERSSSRRRVCQRVARNPSRSSARRTRQQTVETSIAEISLTPATPEAKSPTTLQELARSQLMLDHGHSSLASVVDKMSTGMLEAIVTGSVSESNLDALSQRVAQLRRCTLAQSPDDDTPGTVHWYEVDGNWEFYTFESSEPESPDFPDPTDPTLAQFIHALQEQYQQRRPTPPPRRPSTPPPHPILSSSSSGIVSAEQTAAVQTDEPAVVNPSITIIPWVKRTRVELNFTRSNLEEYMDRNVTWIETLFSVFLAVAVCVVAALLLTLPDFYHNFWAFWLCYVVATAHFSLIKSVQSDAASPTPGQNRTNALSRAVYFILVGSLGLILDAALKHLSFTELCAFGFNLNSPFVLMFVRNGLFIFILFFPVLFTLGWLPQFDTFFINLLEQIDIHVFGGTASTGLVCSIYSIGRSVLAILLLWAVGLAALPSLELGNMPYNLTCTETFSMFSVSMSQCDWVNRVGLSFYLGLLFVVSYMLSRATSNHQYLLDLLIHLWQKLVHYIRKTPAAAAAPIPTDPLDEMYRIVTGKRFLKDLITVVFIFLVVTMLNVTTVFCRSSVPAYVVYGTTCLLGIVNHYLLPHVRKETPFLCIGHPVFKSNEYHQFEVTSTPKVSVVERILQVTVFLEKNIAYPLTFLFGLNLTANYYLLRYGHIGVPVMMAIVGMKIIRSTYSELSRQYIVLILTLLFFHFDYEHLSEGLPLNFFIIAILFNKFYDLYLKMYFMFIYLMPWLGAWSSPFHIIIQPFLIPHTPLIFFEALIGAIVSAPINPIIASSLFFLSYARPIKFWEKNYNTKRADTTNTRLEQQLEGNLRNPNPDHLDSLFYEQLTWSLQRDLSGDIFLGRWGRVISGDFFILTSDQLNALVHIIEIGNGFVTFQLRGLEFIGTYCHQREREAITESISDDEGLCCCEPGHFPYLLSCNKALSSRWLAWEVVSSSYTLHGYSISENQAHLVFNSYDYKRNYITNYVKCIIYLLIKSPRVLTLLASDDLKAALDALHHEGYVELDPLFDSNRNEDHVHRFRGVTRAAFVNKYRDFILLCRNRHLSEEVEHGDDSFLMTLCFAFSLLGRRLFFTHAHTGSSRRGDNFMNGLYRMFLGDARPNSDRDEWIFMDVDSIQEVIIPAARIALKVHQDNFTFSDEYTTAVGVYDAISDVEENHVVTHENDRAWRDAVVMNRPSLLALRYQHREDSYLHPYKIIRLTSKFIKFRVIKMNRECVRGLWSSQQHELIFLRNSDSERGSIQNHKASLRNIVNSSMDLPIGYPIYVSPLQTSFIDRHTPYNGTFVGQLTNPFQYLQFLVVVKDWCKMCANQIKSSRAQARRKGEGQGDPTTASTEQVRSSGSIESLTGMEYATASRGTDPNSQFSAESDSESDEDFWKPMWVGKQVVLTSCDEVFETINENWLQWPDPTWPRKASKTYWKAWRPVVGTIGEVLHEWRPFHIRVASRSHIDKVILMLRVIDGDHLVLVKEQGVKYV